MLVRGCEGGAFDYSLAVSDWCFRLMIPSECVQGQKACDCMGFILQESVFSKAAWQPNRCPTNIVKGFRCFVTETPWTNWIWGFNLDSQSLMFASSVFSTHLFPRFFICDACRTFDQLGEITPETRCTWESKSIKSNGTCCLADFFEVKTILRSDKIRFSRSRDLEDLQNSTQRIAASRSLKKKRFFLGKKAKLSRLLLIKELRDVR